MPAVIARYSPYKKYGDNGSNATYWYIVACIFYSL